MKLKDLFIKCKMPRIFSIDLMDTKYSIRLMSLPLQPKIDKMHQP
jgi:hypothetical protein